MVITFKSNRLKYSLIFFFCALGFGYSSSAQGHRDILQFSGIVIGQDSIGIPGAHIIIENLSIGTISDPLGYFSLPTKVGDTILFSVLGHKEHKIIIPRREDYGFFMIVNLDADTTILPVIDIYPFPTKERFKQAFLALNVPNANRQLQERLNAQTIARLANISPASASQNYRNFITNQNYKVNNRTFVPTLSLTNPFAWAKFINSLKENKEKKKKARKRIIVPEN